MPLHEHAPVGGSTIIAIAFCLLGACDTPAPSAPPPRAPPPEHAPSPPSERAPPPPSERVHPPPAETAPHPSEAAFRERFGDVLELRRVDGPGVLVGYWTEPGYAFCATARAPGALRIGLEGSTDEERASVRIQPRGTAREVAPHGRTRVLDVGDELCLFTPPQGAVRWVRADGAPPPSPRSVLGALGADEAEQRRGASRLAPQLAEPRYVRAGDDGDVEVRFVAAREGERFYAGTSSVRVVPSTEDRVRVRARLHDGGGLVGAAELRPGDHLVLPVTALLPSDDPIPATEFL